MFWTRLICSGVRGGDVYSSTLCMVVVYMGHVGVQLDGGVDIL